MGHRACEYEVDFEPRVDIKAQALADFLQETTRISIDNASIWKAYVDGSVTKEGSGARIYIQDPGGQEHIFAIKFNFLTSNNEAEYEALIRCLNILQDLEAYNVIVHSDSQLVTHHVLGTCERMEERMIAYANLVGELLKKLKINNRANPQGRKYRS